MHTLYLEKVDFFILGKGLVYNWEVITILLNFVPIYQKNIRNGYVVPTESSIGINPNFGVWTGIVEFAGTRYQY